MHVVLSDPGFRRVLRLFGLLLVFLVLWPCSSPGQGLDPDLPLRLSHHELRLGGADSFAVLLQPEADYYLYANASEAGRPTRLGLFCGGEPAGAPVRYPEPVPRTDVLSGKPVDAYGSTIVFLERPTSCDDPVLGLSLLLCSTEHCIPVDTSIRLGPALPAATLSDADLIAAWRSARPGQALTRLPVSRPPVAVHPGLSLSVPQTDLDRNAASEQPPTWWFTVRPDQGEPEAGHLGKAMLLGLIAGLLLNIMPCVLPVLVLKLTSLLQASAEDPQTRIRRFREHNLFFAAGVMVWFAVLALCVSTLSLTWGGLFQYPAAVAALAAVVFLLALSMFDLVTLPIINLKDGGADSPRVQAFLTGLTATLLATPCSGPLLGGVLAWSAAQPPFILLLVFLSTGLGMALPYIALTLWPGGIRLLPRPGVWLLWLTRLVGLFLLGTTLYLLLILPRSWTTALTCLFVVLALVLAWRHRRQSLIRLIAVCLTGLCLGGASLWLSRPQPEHHARTEIWEAFSPASFADALGKEAILLQFTADWCPNCKALEMTTLNRERAEALQKQFGLRLMKVDMTLPDEAQADLLRALDSISIPLTAIFPPGADAQRPIILRDLYTYGRLEAALQQAVKATP